jgi:mRNA-degrading endonuclease toxin of MazEF toxin-antitoxin module
MKLGDVVLADDDVVGFEGGKIGRPYLVVRVIGDPPELVYVVPRTASGWEGVPVPARVLPGLNKEGKFLVDPLQVAATDLAGASVLGELPEPYLSRILDRLRTGLMELDE